MIVATCPISFQFLKNLFYQPINGRSGVSRPIGTLWEISLFCSIYGSLNSFDSKVLFRYVFVVLWQVFFKTAVAICAGGNLITLIKM